MYDVCQVSCPWCHVACRTRHVTFYGRTTQLDWRPMHSRVTQLAPLGWLKATTHTRQASMPLDEEQDAIDPWGCDFTLLGCTDHASNPSELHSHADRTRTCRTGLEVYEMQSEIVQAAPVLLIGALQHFRDRRHNGVHCRAEARFASQLTCHHGEHRA